MENKNMTICKVCGKEIAKGAKVCPNCGKDQRNFFMRHKILTVIGGLIVIGVIGNVVGGSTTKTTSTNSNKTIVNNEEKTSTKQETKQTEKKEEKQKEPEISVTAVELIKAYKENEVSADSKYKGKIATITGKVDSIDSGLSDEAIVRLSSGDKYSIYTVSCYIKDSDKSKAGNLKKGQQVTIVGKLSGETIGMPYANDCTIK